jgi:Rrf2 family protein
MKLSKKARYGLRALCHVANRGHATVQTIAHTQTIPTRYLEEIIRELRQAGFVVGKRGPRGGYRLARPASEIELGDIISALSIEPGGTGASSDAVVRVVEDQVEARFREAVGVLKLEDLLGQASETHRRSVASYMI